MSVSSSQKSMMKSFGPLQVIVVIVIVVLLALAIRWVYKKRGDSDDDSKTPPTPPAPKNARAMNGGKCPACKGGAKEGFTTRYTKNSGSPLHRESFYDEYSMNTPVTAGLLNAQAAVPGKQDGFYGFLIDEPASYEGVV